LLFRIVVLGLETLNVAGERESRSTVLYWLDLGFVRNWRYDVVREPQCVALDVSWIRSSDTRGCEEWWY